MTEKNVYRVRLLRWGDSSSSGRTVTFKLPDDEEDHPFKGLDVGSRNGQLLEMEIAIYDGDGDVETLGRIRKPRARIKPYLPVINDAPLDKETEDPHRRRASLENVSRRVIKSDQVTTAPQSAPSAQTPDTPPAAQSAAPAPAPMESDMPNSTGMGSEMGTGGSDARPYSPAPPVETTSLEANTPAYSGGGPGPAHGSTHGSGGNLDANDLDAYASQMGQAAEALAAVAERLDDQIEEDSPQFPTAPSDADDGMDPGVKAVRRATDLCKAIDKQRAGFYYFMRSRYPEAPKLPAEEGNWSRDAKTTRDRVCLHCEASQLADLAQDQEARKKFEDLETEFERHERLR